MKKRIAAAALALIMFFALVAGCTKKEAVTAKPFKAENTAKPDPEPTPEPEPQPEPEPEPEPEPIEYIGESVKIAVVNSFTGDMSVFGEEMKNAIELCVEQLYPRGVSGHEIELIYYDDKSDYENTEMIYEEIIDNGEIAGVIGPILYDGAQILCEESFFEDLPIIFPLTTDKDILEYSSGMNCFFMSFSDQSQGGWMADYVGLELKKTSAVVVFSSGSSYSELLADHFCEECDTIGVACEKYSFDYSEKDYEGAVNYAVETAKELGVDIMYVPCFEADACEVCERARAAGFKGTFILADSAYAAPDYSYDVSVFDGTLYPAHFAPDDDSENARAFCEAYMDKFGFVPEADAALAYDSLDLLLRNIGAVIEATGSDSAAYTEIGSKVISKLSKFSGDFATGYVYYNQARQGDPIKDCIMMRFKDGKASFVTRF